VPQPHNALARIKPARFLTPFRTLRYPCQESTRNSRSRLNSV
jgi:hypothetical protein